MEEKKYKYKSELKVSHRIMDLALLGEIFKKGTKNCEIIDNEVWEGAWIIYSEIDRENRIMHLYFHDPVNGTLVKEGQDITTVEAKCPTFKTVDKKEPEFIEDIEVERIGKGKTGALSTYDKTQ